MQKDVGAADVEGMNIKAFCQSLGINPNTLRAWERRHGVVTPRRGSNNRRNYSAADLKRLKLITALVEHGYLIGDLAGMDNKRLASLLPKDRNHRQTQETTPMDAVIRSLLANDFSAVDDGLTYLRINSGARQFVLDIAAGLFREVDRLIQERSLSIAQEHSFSAALRQHLLHIYSSSARTGTGSNIRFAFTTPAGELHEFGILLAAILALSHGFSVHYFGPNLPSAACIEGMLASKSSHLVLGTTPSTSQCVSTQLGPFIKEISLGLPDATIIVGGPAMLGASRRFLQNHVLRIPTLDEFDRYLLQVKGSNIA